MEPNARLSLERRMALYLQLQRHYRRRAYFDPSLYLLQGKIMLRSVLCLVLAFAALLALAWLGLVLLGSVLGLELGGVRIAVGVTAAWRAALPLAAPLAGLLLTLWLMVAPRSDRGMRWVFAHRAEQQAEQAARVRGIL